MNRTDNRAYAKALGENLRRVRQERGLSLMRIEEKTEGRWKAVVIGSYERADRAVTVPRLAELAELYGVPVADLLPAPEQTPVVEVEAETIRYLRRLLALLAGEESNDGYEVGGRQA
jgi:transcriptional regulator with XRE-family HTH domain